MERTQNSDCAKRRRSSPTATPRETQQMSHLKKLKSEITHRVATPDYPTVSTASEWFCRGSEIERREDE